MFWKDHPLLILGDEERVEAFGRDDLLSFFHTRYHGESSGDCRGGKSQTH